MVAAGALAGASLSLGAGTGGSNPVNACVKSKTGSARVVSAGAKCRRGEKRLTWNVRGAQGARGPAGARGTDGAPGSNGSAGAPGAGGARGETGSPGNRGTFNFDTFQGMPCQNGDNIALTYGSSGQVTFTCG